MEEIELGYFVETHPPSQTTPADAAVLAQYASLVPESLLELWRVYGFGNYNRGLIQLIRPDHFQDTLATWLGKRVDTYIPIALTAFGELYYYRRLTPFDEDVCTINPHYRLIEVCIWSLDEFFNEYLCNESIIEDNLRQPLLLESVEKLGELGTDEMYCFVPALALGGAPQIQYVEKGNAQVHLDFLFQLR